MANRNNMTGRERERERERDKDAGNRRNAWMKISGL